MHEQVAHRRFSWQEGYGAFTIGMSQIQATVRYISNLERHHDRISFQDEWKIIPQKHACSQMKRNLSRPCQDSYSLFTTTRHLITRAARAAPRAPRTGLFSVAPDGAEMRTTTSS
jgi:hypothetical protein